MVDQTFLDDSVNYIFVKDHTFAKKICNLKYPSVHHIDFLYFSIPELAETSALRIHFNLGMNPTKQGTTFVLLFCSILFFKKVCSTQ